MRLLFPVLASLLIAVSGGNAGFSSNCADCERFVTSMISLSADAYPSHLGDGRDAETQLCTELPGEFASGCAKAVESYGLKNVEAVAATNPAKLCAMVDSCSARTDSLAFLSLDGEAEEGSDDDNDDDEEDSRDEDEGEDVEEAESFLAELKKKHKKPEESGDEDADEEADGSSDDDDEDDDEDEDAGDEAFLETYRKKKQRARRSSGKSKTESELERAAREGIQLGAMGMMNSPLLSAGQSNFDDALDEMGGEVNEGKGPGCCNMPSRTPDEMQEMMGGDSQLQAIVNMPMAMMQNPGDPTAMMMQLGF